MSLVLFRKKSSTRPLVSYPYFHDIMDLIKGRWEERNYFSTDYKFIYPKINQAIKFRHDYIFFIRKKNEK